MRLKRLQRSSSTTNAKSKRFIKDKLFFGFGDKSSNKYHRNLT